MYIYIYVNCFIYLFLTSSIWGSQAIPWLPPKPFWVWGGPLPRGPPRYATEIILE